MFYPLTAPAPRDQPGGFSLQHSLGPGQARGEGWKVWGGDDLRVMREYDENIAVKVADATAEAVEEYTRD